MSKLTIKTDTGDDLFPRKLQRAQAGWLRILKEALPDDGQMKALCGTAPRIKLIAEVA